MRWKSKYAKKAERDIKYELDKIFQALLAKLKTGTTNSKSVLIDAINKGILTRIGDYLYITKPNRSITDELNKIGNYNNQRKAWHIRALPSDIRDALLMQAEKAYQTTMELGAVLSEDWTPEDVSIDYEVVKEIDTEAKRELRQQVSIGELDKGLLQEIQDRYSGNLNRNIKGWHTEQITRLRSLVDSFILEGKGRSQMAEAIRNEWSVSVSRARFLARNETMLLLSEVRDTRWQAEGIEEYIWLTNIDGRERKLHKKLHRTKQRYDSPPIIDERTGTRGHPGQIWNCRCSAKAIIRPRNE